MGRMKELYMRMQEQNPEEFADDAYWAEQSYLQELYEKTVAEEMQKEAELPVNKKITPCAGNDFEQEKEK
jgi:hypothetical protein